MPRQSVNAFTGRPVVAAAVVGLVVLLLVWRGLAGSGDPLRAGQAPGAAALLDPRLHDVVWSKVRTAESVTPVPQRAKDDRPESYDPGRGCQVQPGVAVPAPCLFGDKKAARSVMLVGDSKIAQWESAFADLGEREHWVS